MSRSAAIELDEKAYNALDAFCKETHMKPSHAIVEALDVLRRALVDEKYAGKGELAEREEHPTDTKGKIRKSVAKKHGYIG